jgi:hypothetical protein
VTTGVCVWHQVKAEEAAAEARLGSCGSPFVDMEAFQTLVVEANDGNESDDYDQGNVGDPLYQADLKVGVGLCIMIRTGMDRFAEVALRKRAVPHARSVLLSPVGGGWAAF